MAQSMKQQPALRVRSIVNVGAKGFRAEFEAPGILPFQQQTFSSIAAAQQWLNQAENWLDATCGMPD